MPRQNPLLRLHGIVTDLGYIAAALTSMGMVLILLQNGW